MEGKMNFVDVHVYYGKWGFPIKKMDAQELVAQMEKMNITKAILMSALAINYDFVEGNAIVNSVIEHWDQLYGYIYVNGNYPELSIKEIKKYQNSPKFVGIKVQPAYAGIPLNAPELRPIWEYIEKVYKKPVLIHTWSLPEHSNVLPYSLPEYSIEIARLYPGLKIILGHMGGDGWRECLRAINNTNNIWVDFCCSYMDWDKIRLAVNTVGSDRVLFGTAMTENNGWTQIGALLESDISDEDKQKIASQNALNLFGI